MKYQRWPKRDTDKCYFKMPNEVFCLDLDSKEISIYAYLLRCEDRDTYQCHPSYRSIGKAVKMCENTVRKYVLSLEEKGLIRTEPTTITTKDAASETAVCATPSVPFKKRWKSSISGSSHRSRRTRRKRAWKSGWRS